MSVQLSSNTYTQNTLTSAYVVRACAMKTLSVCVCLELLERASTSTVGVDVRACVYAERG